MNKNPLDEEAINATEMLNGKIVSKVHRFKNTELIIEFKDGSRLFVDKKESGLEMSITQ